MAFMVAHHLVVTITYCAGTAENPYGESTAGSYLLGGGSHTAGHRATLYYVSHASEHLVVFRIKGGRSLLRRIHTPHAAACC